MYINMYLEVDWKFQPEISSKCNNLLDMFYELKIFYDSFTVHYQVLKNNVLVENYMIYCPLCVDPTKNLSSSRVKYFLNLC